MQTPQEESCSGFTDFRSYAKTQGSYDSGHGKVVAVLEDHKKGNSIRRLIRIKLESVKFSVYEQTFE